MHLRGIIIRFLFLIGPMGALCAATPGDCNKIMDKVIADARFDPDELVNLNDCSSKIKTAIKELIPADKTTGPNSNKVVVINATSQTFGAGDDTYFGWPAMTKYDTTLTSLNSYLSQLVYRLYANTPYFGFAKPWGQSGRVKSELASEVRKIENPPHALTPEEMMMDSALKKARTDLDDTLANLNVAQRDLITLMENNGQTEPFSGLLETYLIPYSTAGNNSIPTALTGLNQKTQTFAAGFLSFESEHFRLKTTQAGEFSIGGRVGVTPAETIVTVGSDAKPKAYLQNAFNWSLNVRQTARLGSKTLVAGLFSFGQNVLLADSSVITPAAPTSTGSGSSTPGTPNATAPFGNHTQSGAWFWELGPELRIYPYNLQRVSDEKRYLLPSFSFTSGIRIDDRFENLNQTQYGNFWKPTQRWYLRSFVTLTNVLERNPAMPSSSVFNVGLGFEYDTVWGFPSTGRLVVPADSKVYINASIDLVKAFTKQGGQ